MTGNLATVFLWGILQIAESANTQCHPDLGRCFWAIKVKGNWTDGRAACQSEGGDLAVMETEELYEFVKEKYL